MTLPTPALRSTVYDLADALDVNEFYQQQGWTDGLPIVPPTEERVWDCLAAAGLAPHDLVGIERVRQRPMTAEKVAINAVMAGCLPAYIPVVVAILRAMCQKPFNLHGSTASTGGSAQFIMVYHNPDLTTAGGVYGTPEQVREQLEALVAAGANHLLLNPVTRYTEQVEALAEVAGLQH